MSDAPEIAPPSELPESERYAFNLPPGSVRGILVLMIMVPFWVQIALPDYLAPMPIYLYFLMFWVFIFLFTPTWSISADQASSDQPGEFHLPRFTIHIVLAVVTVGLLAWRGYNSIEDLIQRVRPDETEVYRVPYLILALLAGFLPGLAINRILGSWADAYWFQDIQASVSLIAMLGLAALTVMHLIKATQLSEVNTDVLEYIMIGVVAWYFGARTPPVYVRTSRAAKKA